MYTHGIICCVVVYVNLTREEACMAKKPVPKFVRTWRYSNKDEEIAAQVWLDAMDHVDAKNLAERISYYILEPGTELKDAEAHAIEQLILEERELLHHHPPVGHDSIGNPSPSNENCVRHIEDAWEL
jgi:hypothetical protein